MSSIEIAELTGKQQKHINKDIETTLQQAGIDLSKYGRNEIFANNRTRVVYHLPRFETDLVVSGYSVKYRAAIIKRWHELESVQAKPLTAIEVAKNYVLALEDNQRLELENKAMQSDVAELTYSRADKGSHTSTAIAGRIESGYDILTTKALKSLLKSQHIIRKDGKKWLPAKKGLEMGWVVVKTSQFFNKYKGKGVMDERDTMVFTTKCAMEINKWVKELHK